MTYTLYVTFLGEEMTEKVTGDEALIARLRTLTTGPAALAGWITAIKVVDLMDCIAYEWAA